MLSRLYGRKDIELKFKDEKAVCLVMCSGGYPRNIETGFEITGEDKVKHCKLLYAELSERR
jgi:phosphoribosylamine--glycine ligase